MTIKQQGGIFGRNPTFSDLTVSNALDATSATTTLGTNTVIQTADSGVGPSSSANELMVENADNAGITIATPDFKAGAIFFGKPTGAALGRLQYNHDGTGGYMRFFTNNSEAARFNAAGHLDMTNGHDGNIILASGSGIDFSATSGTGTSELFDDYEEGTFSPTLRGATTDPTQSYLYQFGRYTKIGNRVYVSIVVGFQGSGITPGSGNASIDGLPFAVPAGIQYTSASSVEGRFWQTTNLGAPTSGRFEPGGTTISLWVYENSGGKVGSSTQANAADMDDTARVYLSGFYEV